MSGRLILAVVLFACAIVVAWNLWPMFGCDGQVVRGAFRMRCL